jgi:hypothetical protein
MTSQNNKKIINSSFRDPSGFVFMYNNILYRQINNIYKEHYDRLMNSGLYQALLKEKLIIPHEEIYPAPSPSANGYKIIRPQEIWFISYPYEWCFGQLKDAALTTLRIQKIALDFNMILKDSSAYNIQFYNGQPVLIDTLSFEKYIEGRPWPAYRQFCQHFLAPLALMAYKDVRLGQLSRLFLDGIPLDLVSALLPLKTYLKFSLFAHLHLHAKSQKHFADKLPQKTDHKMNKKSLIALIDNLTSTVETIKWRPRKTNWSQYYSDTNYSRQALKFKKEIVLKLLDKVKPKTLWDFGANTGLFSRLATEQGIKTVAFDNDYAAIEINYASCIKNKEINILPLFLDLTNPSSAIGWSHEERMSLMKRGPVDAVMALAFIHHLAITNNLPFKKITEFFSKIGRFLIIEFVPKTDSNTQKLLAARKDIFTDYTKEKFEKCFQKYFNILKIEKIKGSARYLYLMQNKNNL